MELAPKSEQNKRSAEWRDGVKNQCRSMSLKKKEEDEEKEETSGNENAKYANVERCVSCNSSYRLLTCAPGYCHAAKHSKNSGGFRKFLIDLVIDLIDRGGYNFRNYKPVDSGY